jgi:hypothetical protein
VTDERTTYTDVQQAEFKASFAKRRTRHIAGFVLTMGSILLMVVLPESLSFPFGQGYPPLPFLIGPVFIIMSIFDWRCPACGKNCGGELNPRYCSKCGIAFQ